MSVSIAVFSISLLPMQPLKDFHRQNESDLKKTCLNMFPSCIKQFHLQTVRELTTKVEKLEEADAKRTTESAENDTKPAMIMEPQLMLTAGKSSPL